MSQPRRKLRRRDQRGQSMLEYGLITGTVVMAFAVCYQLGFTDAWSRNLNDSTNSYYMTLPTDCFQGFNQCVDHFGDINFQYQHR